MKFQPWNDAKDIKAPILTIAEPPCKFCRFWQPHPVYDNRGNYTGVRLCNANEMHFDFSCYKEPEQPKT